MEKNDLKSIIEDITDLNFIEEFNLVMKYFNLPNYITEMEKEGLTAPEQLTITKKFENDLKDTDIKNKWKKCLMKNPGHVFLVNMTHLISINIKICFSHHSRL